MIEKGDCESTFEVILSQYAEKTFLKLWSFPSPRQENRKEACDLIALFEDHIFVFFDKGQDEEMENDAKEVNWGRFYRNKIVKQIKTCLGVEKYIRAGKPLYLDKRATKPIPYLYDYKTVKIHKILIVHGTEIACRLYSHENIHGSLGMVYADKKELEQNPKFNTKHPHPFLVYLDKADLIHIFDDSNYKILLNEFDTYHEFKNYLVEKEKAITNYEMMYYPGEEELLATYIQNNYTLYDKNYESFLLEEGRWDSLKSNELYINRKKVNKISYFWDALINQVATNVLNDEVDDIKNYMENTAIYQMAKEPRYYRRKLSSMIYQSICSFPKTNKALFRKLLVLPSFYKDVLYVILLIDIDPKQMETSDDETEEMKYRILEIMCGNVKIKYPEIDKVVGIRMSPPNFYQNCIIDFLMMSNASWDEGMKEYYLEGKERLKDDSMINGEFDVRDFPDIERKY